MYIRPLLLLPPSGFGTTIKVNCRERDNELLCKYFYTKGIDAHGGVGGERAFTPPSFTAAPRFALARGS